LGIIASKKIGNAVARNLTKRKIREVFRHIKGRIEPPMDIMIISGRDLVSLPVSVIEKKIFQSNKATARWRHAEWGYLFL